VKKKYVVLPFFVATNITKLKIILIELVKKKIWANLQRIIELSTQKLALSPQKYAFGIRDPRSEKKPIPDPGSKVQKAPDPGCATLINRY
jgi:hypothetical protein